MLFTPIVNIPHCHVPQVLTDPFKMSCFQLSDHHGIAAYTTVNTNIYESIQSRVSSMQMLTKLAQHN